MSKKCFLLTLLLFAIVYAQETDDTNVKDVETIPQDITGSVDQLASPVQAKEQPGTEIDLNDPKFGKDVFFFC